MHDLLHRVGSRAEFLALKHESWTLRQSSNPVCGFYMMEQVSTCAVWAMGNWHGSSLNQIQGWTTVLESYSRALEQGPLLQGRLEEEEKSTDKDEWSRTCITVIHE